MTGKKKFLDINFAAQHLNEKLLSKKDGYQDFLVALKEVIEAHGGISAISKKTGISRQGLYAIFNKESDPKFKTIDEICKALGMNLSIIADNLEDKQADFKQDCQPKLTVDEDEVEKFSKIADKWWDKEGEFGILHKFNPPRLQFICQNLVEHFKLKQGQRDYLKDLKILDIGCGGGLLSEPLARLGADVTGIDAAQKNIKTAMVHAQKQGLKIDYQYIDVEKLAQIYEGCFDVVLNMEVIEHVADVDVFLEASAKLVKKNGLMFVATINRNVKSLLTAKIGAEYVLRWLPKGTHEFKKFLKPEEIESKVSDLKLDLVASKGVKYSMLNNDWDLVDDLSVNYILVFVKS
jgi:2-polyprenyl-6-hydroxyphenyl methylase/3-demethylubiquinone-9 3-methyltransferase